MDKGRFHSTALALLGIREHKPGTEEERMCDVHSQQIILRALDYARWSFATKAVTLSLTDDSADLPHDCLRIQDCSLPRWQLRGRKLYNQSNNNATTFTLSYTSDAFAQAVSLPDHEPLFCEACSHLLAARLAPRLTSNFQLAQALDQQGNELLYKAKLRDAQATGSNDQKPPSVEDLLYG